MELYFYSPCILHGVDRENITYKSTGLDLNYSTGSLQVDDDIISVSFLEYQKKLHTQRIS
jgi:hypothetical protein